MEFGTSESKSWLWVGDDVRFCFRKLSVIVQDYTLRQPLATICLSHKKFSAVLCQEHFQHAAGIASSLFFTFFGGVYSHRKAA